MTARLVFSDRARVWSWRIAAAAISDHAFEGAFDAAVGLAQTIADILNDPQLLADAQEEFRLAGGAISVEKLLAGAAEQR